MIVKQPPLDNYGVGTFESSVNSYDSQTWLFTVPLNFMFESSVNSYDSQTVDEFVKRWDMFESSVNSYDSQGIYCGLYIESLRVV